MAHYLSSLLYALLSLYLPSESLTSDSSHSFLSLPWSPAYSLQPSYWLCGSLLNQSGGAWGRWGRTETHLRTICCLEIGTYKDLVTLKSLCWPCDPFQSGDHLHSLISQWPPVRPIPRSLLVLVFCDILKFERRVAVFCSRHVPREF